MKTLFLLVIYLGLASTLDAQVTARKTAVRQVDADANNRTNPGDTLRYTIVITNTTGSNLLNVVFSDSNFPHQTLVNGSIRSTPIARPDSYAGVIGNTLFTVPAANGVLTNDSDPDADSLSVVAYSAASAHGGTVSLTNDGGFAFLPAAGYTGADTFTYTVSDGLGGSNTAVVTVNISNTVWYVNNAGANGDGRQTSPFNSLAGAAASSGTNHFIYLFQGSGIYTAGILLKNGQQLVGAGDALVVNGTTILGAGARPTISVTGTNGIGLAAGNVVHGLNVSATTGRAISGAAVGSLAISNVTAAATGGAAVNLAAGTVSVVLDSATSSNSVDNGISLTGIGGSFVANGGAIVGAAGADFLVSGGGGAIAYLGNFNNTAGRSVDISGRTNGTVTLSGTISDAGTGVIVQNCTGGAVTFSGATKTFNTGASAAVTLANNTGSTIAFSSGGLNITTTTGGGFNATGGGTVSVTTGANSNTITSTTGIALNVANTVIGAGGLTFRSISANGAARGIALNATGLLGGLTVTGSGNTSVGGDASGGTIQNTTGEGIALTSTRNPSFANMRILTTADSGVNGTTVTNFSFVNGTINNAGNALFDSAIAFNGANSGFGNNISGALTVKGNSISNAFYGGLDVQSDNGTVTNADVANNTIVSPGFSGINVVGTGSASTAFNLNKATIASNTVTSSGGNGIQVSIGNANAAGPGATAGIPNDPANVVSILGNAISVTTNGTQAIVVANAGGNSSSRTRTNFEIRNNPSLLGGSLGTAVLIGNNGFATMTGLASNNFINARHTPNLGGGNGIGGGNGVAGAGNAWTPDITQLVIGNTVTNTDGNGILLVGRGTTGIAKLKISTNNAAMPINAGGTARPGIRVDAGNASSADDAVYLNIFGNKSAGSNAAQGIGVRKQGTLATTNDFGLYDAVGVPDLPAVPINTDIETFINALNPAGNGTLIISGSAYLRDTTLAPP